MNILKIHIFTINKTLSLHSNIKKSIFYVSILNGYNDVHENMCMFGLKLYHKVRFHRLTIRIPSIQTRQFLKLMIISDGIANMDSPCKLMPSNNLPMYVSIFTLNKQICVNLNKLEHMQIKELKSALQDLSLTPGESGSNSRHNNDSVNTVKIKLLLDGMPNASVNTTHLVSSSASQL